MRFLFWRDASRRNSGPISLITHRRGLSSKRVVCRTWSVIDDQARAVSKLCPLAICDGSSIVVPIAVGVTIAITVVEGIGTGGDVVDEAKPPPLMRTPRLGR